MKRVKNSEYGPLPFEWNIEEIQNIADNEVANSFIDGDWIESKYLEEEGIRLIQTGNIGLGSFKEKKVKKFISPESYEELKCKEVKENDILICRLADPIGRACIVPNLGTKNITSVDIVILRPDGKKYDTQFINHLLNSNKTLAKVQSFSSGTTRQRISRKNLGRVRIPVPPLDEQQKIASILSSVDEALEKTVNIIDCIKKVKQGLMQQLIWNGLNKKEFKDTEIGRIPHDWDIVELRDLGKVITGGTPTTSELDSWKGILPFITPVDISEDKYLVQAERTVNKSVINKNRLFPENSILYTCIGSTIGKIAITQEECTANQQINVIIPHSNVDSDYLYYALLQRTGYIKTLSAQTAVPIINKSLFEKIKIPFPSLNEQKEIAAALNSIDEKISIEKNKIKNLVDIKHGLMQQLLTGKVRVPLNENEEVPQ